MSTPEKLARDFLDEHIGTDPQDWHGSWLSDLINLLHSYGDEKLDKFIKQLCATICPYCEDKSIGYTELHDGRYYTKPGVSPSYENVMCRAAGTRLICEQLKTTSQKVGE